MLAQCKLPSVDIDKLIAAQQKNIAAVSEANRVAVEGVQALARRQVEVLQETMKEASEAVSSLSKARSPAELAAKEAELGKSAFEKSVATMREMAEILVKSSQEATNKINARVAASLDEIRSLGSSRNSKRPSARAAVCFLPHQHTPTSSANVCAGATSARQGWRWRVRSCRCRAERRQNRA